MTRFALSLVFLAATGCGYEEPDQGTQIGLEDSFCVFESTDVVTDLTEAPEGFDASAQEVLDGLLNTFEGFVWIEDTEVVTADPATLILDEPEPEIWLTRQRHEEEGASPEACPDYREVVVRAHTEGLDVVASAPITLRIEDNGRVFGLTEGDPDDMGFTMPDPSEFDPAVVDRLNVGLQLSRHELTWNVAVYWRAETDDGLGEDGGPSIQTDHVLLAEVE